MYKTACIFGGTGFVGRQIVKKLAEHGYRVKVATRVPESAFFLKPCGNVGQVVPFHCNYNDEKTVRAAVQNCDLVVNCVGILFERRRGDFTKIHAELPATIAKACKKEGVDAFVHISALGVDESKAKYAISKLGGEKAVQKAFPKATILRPSIIFGEDDNFFNQFARMAEIMPFLPLIGGGHTKFQPVYVGDVAEAVVASATEQNAQGKIFALGGDQVLSFKEIYKLLFSYTNNPVRLIPVPFCIAKIKALFLSLLPTPLLTRDQVESLKTDNVIADGDLTLKDLGISPVALKTILPMYLSRYIPGGRFAHLKKA